MDAKLYWFPLSHPSQAVRRMLDLKDIDYELAGVLPGNQRVHLRLAGFRGGTVPALKLGGQRVQGSRTISRALDAARPAPALFPADPDESRAVEGAERWGDEEFQPVPRRILRWALTGNIELRRWLAGQTAVPMAGALARVSGLNARYYAKVAGATEDAARRDVAALPAHLDRVDRMLHDGLISPATPNAAAYQVLCTVRSLDGFSDFQKVLAGRPSTAAARQLFPDHFSLSPAPPFVPPGWLA
ncbi:MAG: glutathione S-transferase family protein [Thermoleophilaceae bacterium]